MTLTPTQLDFTRGSRVHLRAVASLLGEEFVAQCEAIRDECALILEEVQAAGGGGGGGPVTYADLPAGVVVAVMYDALTGWPDRPTGLSSIHVLWVDLSGLGGQPPDRMDNEDLVVAQVLTEDP